MVRRYARSTPSRPAIEDDAFDMDVAAIHQGFLRHFGANGVTLALRHRAGRIGRRRRVGCEDQRRCRVPRAGRGQRRRRVGDEVAAIAGVRRLGLTPCRRTAAIIDPSPWGCRRLADAGQRQPDWYARPEARTRLMVSPADETPMHAHDVRPDELDIALAIDRMQQALDIPVHRVEHSWAGLRTFTPDGSLAFGWDARAHGFLWCAGQGGYGIQTSPAAGRLVADLIAGRDPGAAAPAVSAIDPRRYSPADGR